MRHKFSQKVYETRRVGNLLKKIDRRNHMKMLVDIVVKKWMEKNPEHPKNKHLHACWVMYKNIPDTPSLTLLELAVNEVMNESHGIIMLKIDTIAEEKWLKEGGA